MKQIDVAIAIIQRDGLVLICQRGSGGAFAGLWEFPGGKCDPGESPAAAVARELFEELGVRANPHTALAVIEHDYPDISVRLHPFICSLLDGEPKPIAAQSLRWIAPALLREYPFPEANGSLIESVIEKAVGSRQ